MNRKTKKGLCLGRSFSGRKESWNSLEVWASCQGKQIVCHADVHMLEVHMEWNTSFQLKYQIQANSGKYYEKNLGRQDYCGPRLGHSSQLWRHLWFRGLL